MRFPSLDALAARGKQVLVRFPIVLLAGAAAAAAAIAASTDGASEVWTRVTLVAALGLPLFAALAFLAEAQGWPRGRRLIVVLAGGLGLAAFYTVWPGVEVKHHAVRYFQLSAALHLLVAFLPFLGRQESPAFWQFNRRLFLSFLRAVVFSGVLFVGLAIAIAALDKLFGFDVESETYLRLWFVLAFVVNTWIFLAGVPDDIPALASDPEYPRALKVFTQYILTPLVAVYLLILLAYLVKILVTGEWPSGWIGYLVTSVSVAGILGFLLVHPLRDDPGEAWIRTFRRWLFIGLIPAAAMLLVAFAKRIVPYGLTELRYLGVVLGLWLLAVAILYTVRREHGIRIIPLSLALLLLVTLFGPLGATHRAVVSQGKRFAREIAAARTTPSPDVVTPAEAEASGALRFLVEHGADGSIAAAFDGQMPGGIVLPDTIRYRTDSLSRAIMVAASLDYSRWETAGRMRTGHFGYHAAEAGAIPIAGYDWIVPVRFRDTTPVAAGSDTLRFDFDSVAQRLRVQTGSAGVIEFDLASLVNRLEASPSADPERGGIAPELMRVPALGDSMNGLLLLSWINGRRQDGGARIDGMNGQLLIGAPGLE